MNPSRLSRPPSPASPLPRIESEQPQAPVFSTSPSSAPPSTASVRQGGSEAATAAKLLALCSPAGQIAPSSRHKRQTSKELDQLFVESLADASDQTSPRAAASSSSGASLEPPGNRPVLRHAASAGTLMKRPRWKNTQDLQTSGSAGDIDTKVNHYKTWTALAKNSAFFTHDPTKGEGKELERDGQVRMKKGDGALGHGAPHATYLRAAIVLVKNKEGFDERLKDHSTLIRQEDGTWKLINAKTGEISLPISGDRYIFVTMLDGSIRVSPKKLGSQGHAQVSGYAPYVKYAGEVMFDNGKELYATPQSGTYLPPIEKAQEYSGFSCQFTMQFA